MHDAEAEALLGERRRRGEDLQPVRLELAVELHREVGVEAPQREVGRQARLHRGEGGVVETRRIELVHRPIEHALSMHLQDERAPPRVVAVDQLAWPRRALRQPARAGRLRIAAEHLVAAEAEAGRLAIPLGPALPALDGRLDDRAQCPMPREQGGDAQVVGHGSHAGVEHRPRRSGPRPVLLARLGSCRLAVLRGCLADKRIEQTLARRGDLIRRAQEGLGVRPRGLGWCRRSCARAAAKRRSPRRSTSSPLGTGGSTL